MLSLFNISKKNKFVKKEKIEMLSVLTRTKPDGAPPAGTIDPLLFGIFIAIAITAFVVYIFLLQYVYKDAVKRGLKAELWLIILLIAPIPGIIVYFIVRKTART